MAYFCMERLLLASLQCFSTLYHTNLLISTVPVQNCNLKCISVENNILIFWLCGNQRNWQCAPLLRQSGGGQNARHHYTFTAQQRSRDVAALWAVLTARYGGPLR